MRFPFIVVSFAVCLAAGLFACGQTAAPCGPSTCTGCCSTAGECVIAPSAVACGGSGSACVMCSPGQTCVAGLCAGGATGGGSGGGGGATGGGSGSTSQVTGSVNGAPMVIASAAAQRFTGSTGSATYAGLVVRLSEHTAVCPVSGGFGAARATKRFATLRIVGPSVTTTPTPIGTGTYTGTLEVQTPNCNSLINGYNPGTLIESGDAISVTLTEVTNSVRGTFTGMFSSGAPISGSFDAAYCSFYDWELPNAVKCQ